ncbi:MAG: TonB-dependent receptor [Deltaproteobacteria bacterium]|nr:TonB-dependent receptor [Deltaproteobacteria bacterium]
MREIAKPFMCVALVSISAVGFLAARVHAADGGVTDLPTSIVRPERTSEAPAVTAKPSRAKERSDIERLAPRTTPDLVRDEPGVAVQQTTAGQGTPIIRGLMGSAILVLVDGMRLNNAFFRPAPNQFYALVDAYNIESIEMLRGVGSTRYGSDALGGVVSIVTPTPRFKERSWTMRMRAYEQFASADRSWNSRTSLELGRDGFGAALGFTAQLHDDLRGGRATGVMKPSAFSAFAGDAKLFFESARHELTLSVQYLQQPSTPRYDALVAGFGQSAPENVVSLFEPNDRLFVHYSHRLSGETRGFREVVFDSSVQFVNDNRRAQKDATSAIERERNASYLAEGRMRIRSSVAESLEFNWGLDFSSDGVASRKVETNPSSGVETTALARYADGSSMLNGAAFVEATWKPEDAWDFNAGLRFNVFDVNIPVADRSLGTRLSRGVLTGGAGVAYQVTRPLALVANVGRAFRAPNVFDLSLIGERPGNRTNIPNPKLGPESVFGVDVGLKLTGRSVTGELFLFYADYSDKIESRETGDVTTDGRKIVQSQNVNQVWLSGAEAAVRWRLSAKLTLSASLTFVWGDEKTPTGLVQPASRIPPLGGQVGLSWRPTPRFFIEPFLRYATTQSRLSDRDKTDPRINPNGTPGWVTTNLRAGWTLHKRVSARLTIENVIDYDYREHGSGMNAPGLSATLGIDVSM